MKNKEKGSAAVIALGGIFVLMVSTIMGGNLVVGECYEGEAWEPTYKIVEKGNSQYRSVALTIVGEESTLAFASENDYKKTECPKDSNR